MGTEDEPLILPETSHLQKLSILDRPVSFERLDSLLRELYERPLPFFFGLNPKLSYSVYELSF